jgi:Na(+)-translocating NADH:ubiquinone oxidoreductase A subunit
LFHYHTEIPSLKHRKNVMKFRGGYNLQLTGKPDKQVTTLPVPDTLRVPLFSLHGTFSKVLVKNGDSVTAGQMLAVDPRSYNLPLCAPVSGTVKVDTENSVITLSVVAAMSPERVVERTDTQPKFKGEGETGIRRLTLFTNGAWQVITDVFNNSVADPSVQPDALIVSADNIEPFLPQAECLAGDNPEGIEQGLRELHALSGVKTVFVTIHATSGILQHIRSIARKNSWISLIETPAKYPFDNPKLIAQQLHFSTGNHTVWSCTIEGVLATARVLSDKKPYLARTIAIGGPGAKKAAYVTVPIGYPLELLLAEYAAAGEVRAVNGGALSGAAMNGSQGIDIQCTAVTLIPEQVTRDFLAFANPGFSKHSFSRTFFGALRPLFSEKYTTGIRGERRPCLTCCFCEEVCPAGLMPHLIYKYVKKDRLDDARRLKLMECVQCGLCSHVCTSKIEIKQGFLEAHRVIRQELQAEKEHA